MITQDTRPDCITFITETAIEGIRRALDLQDYSILDDDIEVLIVSMLSQPRDTVMKHTFILFEHLGINITQEVISAILEADAIIKAQLKECPYDLTHYQFDKLTQSYAYMCRRDLY